MKQTFNNMNPNMNLNNILLVMYILSFLIQWSILRFILNLVTLWLFRPFIFVLFIIDAITIFLMKNKTIKRPSFILSKIWDIIDYFIKPKYNSQQNNFQENMIILTKLGEIGTKITNTFNNIKIKLINFKDNIINLRKENNKYNTERQINKFSNEIGSKVTIEYIEPGKKLHKKTFKYKDRLTSYIRVLESNGYKDYTKYNVNLDTAPAYIIINKNRDLVDIEKNIIKLNHNTTDYSFILNDWPKK
ncbi:hypothetical protein [Methanosphaera sp. WGK6]|uniref:hypothetical protein n=1 Tax=Methanosphaera sp. WGK6 TaxID=1561964 RepID=UPI00084C8647|nr:hypothetical protein [Methanosphaera sp. WGK6]OED30364.1 hypothetical protein NL43_03035 [Methanosphaera sp. WGK6]